MGPPATYHELYSVSDLHLGGAPGHQIFSQGTKLAAFVDYLQARPAERQVALVLNGDIVDFLAEEGSRYLSPERAPAMLEHIFRDPAFAAVWKSLARYVRTPGRTLVLVLGNHDVELALPTVQARLFQELTGGDAAARARIVTAMDGAGFECLVGRARVLCSHGNEVDSWNIVDYEALKKVAVAVGRGQAPPPWDPNAGTQLVIDVMNRVKARFPFVDLLKPETKLVPKTLLALDPGALESLKSFGSIVYRKLRGTLQTGYLGGPEDGDGGEGPEAEESVRDLLLGKDWRTLTAQADSEEQVLRQMEEDFRAGLYPLQLAPQAGKPAMLGLGEYLWDRLTGSRTPSEALRAAMKDWLGNGDKTFATDQSDDTYERMDQRVGAGVDFVLCGHTHLARAIPRKQDHGMYYNSGTWIRLIRLTPEALGSAAGFAPVYQALTAGTMDALDQAQGLVWQRPSVVTLLDDPSGTIGELKLVQGEGTKITLEPEEKTRFVRS